MSEFLKCDADGCDHIEAVESITADMVGKSCPKCGASLLTQEDWEHFDNAFRPAMEAMKALGLIKSAAPGEAGALRFNYHDGELRVKLHEPIKAGE